MSTVLLYVSRVSAGAPNITATWQPKWGWVDNMTAVSGAITSITVGGGAANPRENTNYGFNFNASRCSSIYGSSNTITPISRKCVFCIKY